MFLLYMVATRFACSVTPALIVTFLHGQFQGIESTNKQKIRKGYESLKKEVSVSYVV
jgi:hypothetical protein